MGSCQGIVSCFSFIRSLTDAFQSPCIAKEVYDLHHTSTCNVIEWIFGILKHRFKILQLAPEYNMSIQALIPPVLAALHNFIQQYDPSEITSFVEANDLIDFQMGYHEPVGVLGDSLMVNETRRANARWDRITDDMWAQYQHYLENRVVHNE